MRADMDYRLMGTSSVLERGHGQIMTMSRKSVWLESDNAFRVGALVELAVTWPVRLDNKIPLRLIIHGRTVSADGRYAKVEILRHEFRTRALSSVNREPLRTAATTGSTVTASA